MITRKAAIGFILLAIIVFPTAYMTWQPPMSSVPDTVKPFNTLTHRDDSVQKTWVYRPPAFQFANPLDMAIAVTAILEIFAMGCYLGLKRIEPWIIGWEEEERERIREEVEYPKENS
jgi:hypothetical protein